MHMAGLEPAKLSQRILSPPPLTKLGHMSRYKESTPDGIRTRDPRIRSPMRYPLRHRSG